jgi:Tfp pilus assembly protein PilF
MRTVTAAIAVAALTACSGNSFQHFYSSGEAYLAAQRYAEAAIEFQNAARLAPESVDVHRRLGEIYAMLNRPAAAATAYERACVLEVSDGVVCPEAAEQLAALGAAQWDAGNALAAETSLLRAVDLDPGATAAQVSLARLYLASGHTSEAARRLRALLEENPTDVTANRVYADYLVGLNQCLEAEPYLRSAAEHSPDDSGALALADYYVFMDRPDEALRILNPLVEERNSQDAAERVAAIAYDRGDRAAASRMVDNLLARDASRVNALTLKARMLLDSGEIARAQEVARLAAAGAPEAPAVQSLLAEARQAELDK